MGALKSASMIFRVNHMLSPASKIYMGQVSSNVDLCISCSAIVKGITMLSPRWIHVGSWTAEVTWRHVT